MKVGSQEYKEHIDNLNIFKKLEVYMDWVIVLLAMKYDFHMVKAESPLSKPYKYIEEYTGELRYLWLDTKIESFEDFMSYRIYDWYWKYKDKLKQNIK